MSIDISTARKVAHLARIAVKEADLPATWVHERDREFLMLWGRLGYDPDTGDRVFEQALTERFGAAGPALA